MLISIFLYHDVFRNSIFATPNVSQTLVVLITRKFESREIKDFSPDPVCRNVEYSIKFLKEHRSDTVI